MEKLTNRVNMGANQASYTPILQIQEGEDTSLLAFVSNHDVSVHGDYNDARRARTDFMKKHYSREINVVESVTQEVETITLGDLEFEKAKMRVIFQPVVEVKLPPVQVLYYEAPLNDHEFFAISLSTTNGPLFAQVQAALDAAVVTK
jgi:hypothetical protein